MGGQLGFAIAFLFKDHPDLIIGARPVVEAAKKTGKFDFDAPIEGLRALDRYTLTIRMSGANYPNIRDILGFVGAAAREVVEAAGGDIRARPVGTGPYRFKTPDCVNAAPSRVWRTAER